MAASSHDSPTPPRTVLATESAERVVKNVPPARLHTMTIEELANQVGMTVRNVRAYNSAGLLSPPTLRGRLGLYGEEHVAQLQVIRSLRNQGLSLERIKAVVEQEGEGQQAAWTRLGELARTLSGNIIPDTAPQTMTLAEIAATWHTDFTPARLELFMRSGLQRILSDGSIEYLTPGLRNVAQQLAEMGMSLDHALTMQEAVSRDLRQVVRAFLRVALQHAGDSPDAVRNERTIRLLKQAPQLLQESVRAMLPVLIQQEARRLSDNYSTEPTARARPPTPGPDA